MGVILFPPGLYNSGSGGGQTFSNAATLLKLGTDADGNLSFNGKTVGDNAREVALSYSLSKLNISQAAVELPDDCDSSRSITVALQGVATQQGIDWEVIDKVYPQLDLISWKGLGLQAVAQAEDILIVTYYKKL